MLLISLMACTPANTIAYLPGEVEVGQTLQTVFIATNRIEPVEDYIGNRHRSLGGERGESLRLGWADVSIPPTHQTGEIEWAPRNNPDPDRHFVVRGGDEFESSAAFIRALQDAAPRGDREVVLYVHGYNTNFARVLHRVAQVAHDYDEDVPVIAFSWPSAGTVDGYVYDRDSVVFSRDDLEDLLVMLDRAGRDITLIGHSMGTQLVMETLRQMSIGDNRSVLRDIESVILASPDIDPEVFRRQAARVEPFPEEFVIMTSTNDEALALSAWLTGKPRRLGSLEDASELGDLPVEVIDLTEFSRGGDGLAHNTSTTSPEAIAMLRALESEDL